MRRLANALSNISAIYLTGVITLVWFHNSLRKLSLFLDKRCFNPSLRSPETNFSTCA